MLVAPGRVWAQEAGTASNLQRQAVADDALWSYRRLLGSGDYAQAAAAIQTHLRSGKVPAAERWRLTLDLAKALRFAGKTESAEKSLSQLADADAMRPMIRVEKAWQLVLAGKGTSALPMLETLRTDSDVQVRCHAGYLLGKVSFEQQRIQVCLDAYDTAIREFRQVDFYHNPYDWELLILRRQLQTLRAEARDHRIADQFGPDFANYRRGRLAQARGEHREAIGYYRLVQTDVLQAAAVCYIGSCLRDAGELKAAADHWQAFIAQDELGLYRGEAMLELGEMLLVHATQRQHLLEAQRWLKQALDWHDNVALSAPAVTADSIKEILKVYPLPAEATSRDRFGNFYRRHVGPEAIINRLTATWYLKDLHLQAAALHAFVLLELKLPEAAAALEQVISAATANPGLLDLGDTPQRLVTDARDGAFILPSTVWHALDASVAIPLHLACYHLRIGRWQQAEPLLRQVHGQVHGKPERLLEWSAAQLGRAHASFDRGKREEALRLLAPFETSMSQSPLAPLGILWAANIHAGQKDGLTEAQSRYALIVKTLPESDIAARAMLSLAIASENAGDRQTAIKAVSTLLEQKGESPCKAAARTLVSRLQGVQLRPARATSNDASLGRIIPFDRHLVIPGHVDFSLNLSQYTPGDLVNYEIAYTIRAGCSLSSFSYRSSIDEPQPPAVGQSPLRFLRSPLLVMAY